MAVPFNHQDYMRILALGEAIAKTPRKAELSTFIMKATLNHDGNYVSLEIKGYLTDETIDEILYLSKDIGVVNSSNEIAEKEKPQ